MIRQQLTFISIFLLLVFVYSGHGFCVEDSVVAVVNNEVITRAELDSHIKLIKLRVGEQGWQSLGLSEHKALTGLIEDRLVLQAAKNEAVEVQPREVDARIDDMKRDFPSEAEFQRALSMQGLTFSELQERVREQIMSDAYITEKVRTRILVSPKEVTEYYQAHSDELQVAERLDAASIFVSEKQTAEDINRQLHKGADFKELQKQYSTRASINAVYRGELRKEIEDIIFDLQPNNFSKPIEVEDGYYIFFVYAKISPQRRELIEAQDEIREIIQQEKFRVRLQGILEDLRSKAYIIIKDEMLTAANE